ncbi:MAG: hypothetical protein MJK14_24900 [Rivularia sp. ALOHA_DT_140]|nr:hypothetical protein [Rivularia sp. ALOHA_DT_140]
MFTKRNLIFSLCILLLLTIIGCSSWQSGWERFSANVVNKGATVKCYSGGQLIYESRTNVKPISEEGSDGYFFRDAKTGNFIEISADCIFIYDK